MNSRLTYQQQWVNDNRAKVRRYGLAYYYRNHKKKILYGRKYKSLNPEKVAKWRTHHIDSFRDLLWSLKSNPCFDCKQWLNPWQMQFDHLPEFEKNGGVNMTMQSYKVLWREVAKCQLVCANCHTDRTYKRSYQHEEV